MEMETPIANTLTLRNRHVRQQSVCAVVVRRRLFGGDEGVEAVVGGAESSASRDSGDSMYERMARHGKRRRLRRALKDAKAQQEKLENDSVQAHRTRMTDEWVGADADGAKAKWAPSALARGP
ncbi:hypothetical protein PT974_08259 [Cladobotryum mycophilum]|uniref:IBB domain-containing protein n=1 Tax=Cladobotryum mycophilum TaxID=491253 RepID=A0ABR0SCW6_9HYPO